MQACKKRDECRKAAHDLAMDLGRFLSLKEHVGVLEEREKSRKAVRRMLELIAEIANYICNLAPSGIRGASFHHRCKEF